MSDAGIPFAENAPEEEEELFDPTLDGGADQTGVELEGEDEEPEETTEQTAPEAEPTGEAEAELTDAQINLAYEMGFSGDEIASLTPGQLEMLDRTAAILQSRSAQSAPETGGEAGTRRAQPARATPAGEGGYRPLELPLDDLREDFGDRFDPIFEPMVERFQAIDYALMEILGQLDSVQAQTRTQVADRFFGSLGDEYAATFGKGPTSSLPPGSKLAQARRAVREQANDLMQIARRRGQNLSYEQALQQAAVLQTHDKIASVEREKVRQAAKKQTGQAISRPSARGSMTQREELGREAAIAEVEKVLGGGE